jgi:hypothetical protein
MLKGKSECTFEALTKREILECFKKEKKYKARTVFQLMIDFQTNEVKYSVHKLESATMLAASPIM